jgi:excinuclease ABC subunit A
MNLKNNFIRVKGAKANNLRNIDVDIPRNKLVVITGVSGSGKSSLAFDTLYAEGQRKYVEGLSSYARQFLNLMDKPDAEKIEGISPAIAISPRKALHTPRSTVGTITEIYDYLRLLFSKIGKPHCPECGKLLVKQDIQEISKKVLKLKSGDDILILSPLIKAQKGDHKDILREIKRKGFVRLRIDSVVYKTEDALAKSIDADVSHNIEVVIDELMIDLKLDKKRLLDSLRIALRMGKGIVIITSRKSDLAFNENFICEECGTSLEELEPRFFSFNSPLGACSGCTGLGEKAEIDPEALIPNKNLTIEEGAIRPFVRNIGRSDEEGSFWNQFKAFNQRHKFSLNEPVKNFSKEKMDLILYGDKSFDGVIPILEKKYRESASDWTHQEIEQYMIIKKCPVCSGKRLRPEALAVKIFKKSIIEITELSVDQIKDFFLHLLKGKERLSKEELNIAEPVIKEIVNRIDLLIKVGLNYLALDRKAGTLSGGEEQRIRLSMQIGARLNGVLYVLDEPSIGLHAKDQENLIKIIKELRDLGNTVIVVEHDPQTIREADWIIDVGPGAGKDGGRITFEGTPKNILKSKTLTGLYLSGKKKIESLSVKKSDDLNQKYLIIKNVSENNLKNINVKIPLGKFIAITGVSGSGKSSLVDDVLAKALLKKFYRAKDNPGKHKEILGTEFLNKVVLVDQSPIGRTPRSNPATYVGIFSFIRDIFANTREAQIRSYSPGRFSFNVKGGRCEACEGQGQIKVEMYFLSDVYALCQECHGKRYNKEALEIEYRSKNIAEVLDMTVKEAMDFFKGEPGLFQKLKILDRVGLSYMKLGQPAPSLSGGEAQRVKLATELSRKDTGNTLYILDEPTTGLHFDDINKLIGILRDLADKGNTILAVEHNLDFIKASDWIIDLGPDGGDKGGYIVAEGRVRDIIKSKKSWTGKYLKKMK